MIRAAFAVLLLAVAPAAAAVSGDPINLQTIRQRLAELGPTATVRELDGAGRWEQVSCSWFRRGRTARVRCAAGTGPSRRRR